MSTICVGPRRRPGDIAACDNRWVLHRARPDDPTEARYMVHARVDGGAATEHAAMVPAPSF
jgi:hypothetical protein